MPDIKGRANTDKPERRTRADDKFDRYAWRDAVFSDPKTPANAKCLAFGIAKHVNGETGEAVVWSHTLADLCGFSQTWVRKTIPVLHNTGWAVIQIGSRGRGWDHCNVYRINPVKRTPSALMELPKKRTRGALFRRLLKENFSPAKENFSSEKETPGCTEPLNPENPKKERGSAAHSSDADSQSTINDAPNSDEPPNQRAPGGALIDPVTEQQPPSRDISEKNIGRPGPNGHAAPAANPFEQVLAIYPADRVRDEMRAYFLFVDALDLLGHLDAILEGIASLKRERGANLPDLTDVLTAIIDRNPVQP